ncbi:AT-rich interactive domain-containing protein 3A [Blomia tropicalis]|nr:AT-rich interactive domain-containing protein 3A [Blomia tropicalis]
MAQGTKSNQEDDEDMHESDYNSDDEVGIRNGTTQNGNATMAALSQLNLDAIGRIKTEDMNEQASEMLARFKQQQHEYDEREDLDEDLKPEERSQRLMFATMQRHAAHVAAAAAAAVGLPNAAHFANLAASVGSLSGMHLNSAAMCQLNSALLGSNSSPGGASGSSGSGVASSPALQSIEPGKGYTYEEQFKQLYEINDDPKRKPFLDDLFSFMQKRATPINRIPIMAKQVLDLYELYQLVVARGGLVEVINKKIWREITKGLNLPSSITSAAFTLRTQYMKYLYPYECEKEKLSSPDELQMAIDGNRREGRRSSYGQYPDLANSPPPPSVLGRNNMFGGGVGNNGLHVSPLSLISRQLNGHSSQGHSSGDEDNGSVSSNPSYPLTGGQNEALNLEVTPRASNDSTKNSCDRRPHLEDMLGTSKRFCDENFMMNNSFPSTHMKISSKDGRALEGQLTVSMEINGILYHGILFAQSNNRNKIS